MNLMHSPSVALRSRLQRPSLPPCGVQSEAFSEMFREDVWADRAAPGTEPTAYKFTQLIL